jgi:hypothetical protein
MRAELAKNFLWKFFLTKPGLAAVPGDVCNCLQARGTALALSPFRRGAKDGPVADLSGCSITKVPVMQVAEKDAPLCTP